MWALGNEQTMYAVLKTYDLCYGIAKFDGTTTYTSLESRLHPMEAITLQHVVRMRVCRHNWKEIEFC